EANQQLAFRIPVGLNLLLHGVHLLLIHNSFSNLLLAIERGNLKLSLPLLQQPRFLLPGIRGGLLREYIRLAAALALRLGFRLAAFARLGLRPQPVDSLAGA